VKSDNNAAILGRAAARARTRPEFLANVLAAYQDIEGMAETRLRKHLGVTMANWARFQLCLRPRAEVFLKDVTQIADEFGIDRGILAAIIRRVDAVKTFQQREQPGQAGTLLAARTRKGKRHPGKSEGRSNE
jgi:hypothetical protein